MAAKSRPDAVRTMDFQRGRAIGGANDRRVAPRAHRLWGEMKGFDVGLVDFPGEMGGPPGVFVLALGEPRWALAQRDGASPAPAFDTIAGPNDA